MVPKTKPCVMHFSEVTFAPRFEHGDQAQVVEVIGTGNGTKLGTGFGRFTNAEFPWAVQYDEVLLVLEGQMTVRTPDGEMTAGPMDCIWLPKGTAVIYVAESALVFYAITPANWADAAS